MCRHKNTRWTSSCQIYQICDDCGAIRKRVPQKTNEFDAWHTCKLCTPQLYKEEIRQENYDR